MSNFNPWINALTRNVSRTLCVGARWPLDGRTTFAASQDWIPATEVPAVHPLVAPLLNASEQVLGWRPKLTAFPGGTDAAKFQGLAEIPTIPSFGPGWLWLAHGPNECVGIEAIVQAAKMYALAAQIYLSGGIT